MKVLFGNETSNSSGDHLNPSGAEPKVLVSALLYFITYMIVFEVMVLHFTGLVYFSP